MSLYVLPKDCYQHVMSFLPCPMDRVNLVKAVGGVAVEQALEEPCLWKIWKDFNVTHPTFLQFPETITTVLDNVTEIDKVSLKLPKGNSELAISDIIEGIEASDNILWDAKQLEIQVESVGLTESFFVQLVSIIISRLGRNVSVVKFHVNERPRYVSESAVQIFFAEVLKLLKFNGITSLDLDTSGRRVGQNFEAVLDMLPLTSLKISSLKSLLPTCLHRAIRYLEELSVVNCTGINIQSLIANFNADYFLHMKKAFFSCKSLPEGLKWNMFCHQCFDRLSFDIVITEPMNDMLGMYEEEHEKFILMKEVVRFFIESELDSEKPDDQKHTITIGEISTANALYVFHMRALKDWIEQFNFQLEEGENAVQYKVGENSFVRIVSD